MCRMRIEMTTDILDFFRYRAGSATLGTLESHMLKKVGNAVLMTIFVTSACIDPDTD